MQRMETDFVKDSWWITFQVLNKWRDASPNWKNVKAMVEELTAALRSIELNDVAQMERDGKVVSDSAHPSLWLSPFASSKINQ